LDACPIAGLMKEDFMFCKLPKRPERGQDQPKAPAKNGEKLDFFGTIQSVLKP
jgi:hypothetical protein